jgi:aminopeptidase-like protein
MLDLIRDLYPICRSITGNGVRETLKRIGEITPVEVFEVPTGTKVFDWEVPREWNIRDAWIMDPEGRKIVDFKELNLHVLNYSLPRSGTFDLAALKEHLFTIPEKPGLVPYRTSYYQENWGFCMSHRQMEALQEGDYRVHIDASLEQGSLTYGEVFIPGKSDREILVSTHICHPSLCNDNLSGIAVNACLARALRTQDNFYSYRFIFIPGTIGAITWLARNEDRLDRIRYGIVTALLGLDDRFTFKRARQEDARVNTLAEYVLAAEGVRHEVLDFIPYGYDERQFCSPGINLPVGNLSRVPYGQYPEYHTSADNLDLISEKALEDSRGVLSKILAMIDADHCYLNLFPKGEPQLGRRGLYDNVGGRNDSKEFQLALLWVLNYSDGNHSLADIVMRSGLELSLIREAAALLEEKGLLKELLP